MTTLFLVLLFAGLALFLLEGNWRGGLIYTVAMGFVQDPLRKITPGQPSTMVGIVLVGFVLCALLIFNRRQRFDLKALFWGVPQLGEWLFYFLLLIGAQALNSLYRFGTPALTVIGSAFYLAPIIGLWVGFHVGCDQKLLRRLIIFYLILCTFYAFTILLDFRGYESDLFKEVGAGIQITFEGGSKSGASGLFRTSEIASWHLAAGACFAIILASSAAKQSEQVLLLCLSVVFSVLTVTTGRRKATVLVLTFAGLYLLLFSRRADPHSRERLITTVLGVAGLSYGAYAVALINILGDESPAFLNRAFTAKDDIAGRFESQGLGAALRGYEISDGFGLGVGAGSNLGNLQLSANRNIQSLGYVSEGGGGRLIVELGVPGTIVLVMFGLYFLKLLIQNWRLLRYLPRDSSLLIMGLMCFTVANLPLFFSAAQLYGDPFVLIMLSLCVGPMLSVPALVAARQQQLAFEASRLAPS